MKQKIFSLLVALFAMTTGSWAQTQITQDFENGLGDWTTNHCNSSSGVTSSYTPHGGSNNFRFYFTVNYPQYLISPEIDAAGGGTMSFYYASYDVSFPETFKVGYSTTTNDPTAFTWGNEVTCTNKYTSEYLEYTYDIPAGAKYVAIACTSNDQFYLFVDDITIDIAPDGPKVTINDAKTEASFTMPAYDATVNYDIVRDMTVQMTTQVGTGNDGYRIRIKKDNQTDKFVPAEMTPQQMAGLITVTDDIEQQELTNVTDYTVSIFAVDDNDQPTGNAIAFADLTPGRYVAIATAADGSAYDGATEQSNVFVLFQGYEVTIPAGEYATYYKDEALYVDATEQPYAKLYTVTDVSETTATVTELTVAPALTPILLQNTAQTTQTILLIPTTTTDVVNYYDGFKGTLVDQEMPASSETVDYYVCNGKEFFWVKDAGTIRANRCWLEIANSTTQGARSLAIVFGEATKITNTNFTNLTNGDWYDLNGRKLNAIPTKKGIYILNGRKVVVK